MSEAMNRRAVLAGAAAATAVPVAALPISGADPIHAAIEARKQTLAAMYAAPAGVDIPDALGDADWEAICTMLSTPPTTLDGLRALLAYVTEREQAGDNILETVMADEGEPFADWDGSRPLKGGAALLGTIATALDQL